MLVQNLPPDSALHRAVAGHAWTRDRDWLAADAVDALRQLLVLTANVNRDEKSAPIDPPEPVRRPGAAEAAKARAKAEAKEIAEARAAHARIRSQLLPGR